MCRTFSLSHDATVTLKDGRSYSRLSSLEIRSILTLLAEERINPDKNRHGDGVKEHFAEYTGTFTIKSPEDVLNKIFAENR